MSGGKTVNGSHGVGARKLLRGEGDPSGGVTATAGVIFAVALLLVILLLEAMYYRAEDEQWVEKVVDAQPEELRRVRSDQEGRLNSYRWVDSANRITAIPIDRAMELEVRDLAAGGVRANP